MSQPRSIPEGLRAGLNKSGADLAAGVVVVLDGTNFEGIKLPASADDAQLGITMNAIPNGTYGDVQTRGVAVGLSGGAISAGARLGANTAGKLIPIASGKAFIGIAKTDASDGDLFELELCGPGARNV